MGQVGQQGIPADSGHPAKCEVATRIAVAVGERFCCAAESVMKRHAARRNRHIELAAAVSAVIASLAAAAAEAQPPDARLAAHLAAGEFAPAVAMAQNAAAPEQHDAILAQVAAAQARAGARNAALRTAGAIYDDRSRSGAIAQVSSVPIGGRGGGNQADFDSIIELITTTIQPTTWDEVGGPGSIAPFPTGVYVDAEGTLKPLLKRDGTNRLTALHAAAGARLPVAGAWTTSRVRQPSNFRMVSLPRLERRVQLRLAAGQQPTEAMQTLAGLKRIEQVFIYPDRGDLVVAGPAGDWQLDEESRLVGTDDGQPVVRLDDLVVILQHVMGSRDNYFGCAITPTQEALARAKQFIEESSKRPIGASSAARNRWIERLRAAVGKQKIEVYALDPRTRVARVLVEADYRMKLVGMGLEEGVPGVDSYLDTIPGDNVPPMGVLRWWFTLNYDAVVASPDRRAFEFRGQGVKVLSENELLTAQGKRVHTNASEPLNRRFAAGFTRHFDALARKYPVYADLRNVFDLALFAALIESEGLADKVGWHMTCFGDPAYPVERLPACKQVDTVVNYRVIRPGLFVTGVSGGVSVRPSPLVSSAAIDTDSSGTLAKQHAQAAPTRLPQESWWWD